MNDERSLAAGHAALASGRWSDALTAFEAVLSRQEIAEACFGLGVAQWWLGESRAAVDRCERAYALFRRAGDVDAAVQCAVWLGITYKADFANAAAANGWLSRAERLVEPRHPGLLHAWIWLARAYRMDDLLAAGALSTRAVELARREGDVDLELAALSQIGLIRVGQGETGEGFALIDEALAVALAGEASNLDTVVYACCDMLNACELAGDTERAAQWCTVADTFVETYGCPFLYAECRTYYGSVLLAQGRWDDAERQLSAAVQLTEGSSPGLHARAVARLAGLRVRQGRLEESAILLSRLGAGIEAEAEEALTLAALQLARGDAPAAGRHLEQRLHRLQEHRSHLAAALDLLVDAHLAAGEPTRAATAVDRLTELSASVSNERFAAIATGARGRVQLACGDTDGGIVSLEAALAGWSKLDRPYETALVRAELGRALADAGPDLAVSHARRALETFEMLGASLDADRSASLLRSLGVTTRAGRRRVGSLTRREQEVLRLLANGLSNPEIAERLYVSRKTASHHVSSILTKLDLRNRAEAAAYAVSVFGPEPPRP